MNDGPQPSLVNLDEAFHTVLEDILKDPPPSQGCFLSSANLVVRSDEILALYNLMIEYNGEDLRRIRYATAAVLMAQIEDGTVRGHFSSTDNRTERRHGLNV
jgi:hypothetical protein